MHLQQQLSTQIAKRYVEVGDHLKALNLIEQLHQQNYIHQNLTDLKFLLSGFSNPVLLQILFEHRIICYNKPSIMKVEPLTDRCSL